MGEEAVDEAGVVQKKEVGDAEIDALDANLEQILEFVPCVAWACRAVYAEDAKWITPFQKLRENLQKEACVFKQGLLPLTLAIITGMSTFLHSEYLDIELNVWRKRIDKVVEGAVEQSKLFTCLAEFYRYLNAEVCGRAAAAREILDTVLFEARAFDKTRRIVHVKSNVREEIWVPLLFAPYIGCFATPWAVKNEDSSMSKRIAAKSEGEMAVAAAWCQTDTLAPAILKVAGALDGISEFFSLLLPPLEVLATAEDKEDPVWEEQTEFQLRLIKERAFRLRMKCLDLVALQSSMEFTLEPVPNMTDEVVDEYVKEWLASKKAPAELSLVVNIVSARGLPSTEAEEGVVTLGGSDPYCVCMIPSKKRSTIKTRVIRDNCSPMWNFEGFVPDYMAGDSIEFLVFDKDYGKEDDLLATCLLEGSAFYPNGFTGDVPLKVVFGNSDKEAFIRLKLRVVDAKTAGEEAVGVKLADKMRDATENTEVVWALEP